MDIRKPGKQMLLIEGGSASQCHAALGSQSVGPERAVQAGFLGHPFYGFRRKAGQKLELLGLI